MRTLRLTSAVLTLATLAAAQGTRQAAPAVTPVDTSSLLGRWQYQFTIEQPALSAEQCQGLIAALVAARNGAPDDALESLVRETQAIRELAAQGGRKAATCQRQVTYVAATETTFYERTDVDGGWQKGGSVGFTCQVLRGGDQNIWTRQDSSRTEGFAQPYYVDAVKGRQDATNSLLACEARQHALAINYCIERGSASADGRQVTVADEVYAKDPPVGLAVLYVGTSLVMRCNRVGERAAFAITLFDDDGRPCKEWLSEWVNGRPRMLEERESFSASTAVNTIRRLKVVDYTATGEIPDTTELAMTPFERRVALDYRQPRSPEFDPTAGAPSLDLAVAPATAAPHKAPTPPAHDHAEHATEAAPAPQPTLTAIPVHVEEAPANSAAIGMFALALLGVAGAAALRWQRVRKLAVVASLAGGVMLAMSLVACAKVGAQSGEPSTVPAADALDLAEVEVLPATVQIAPVTNPGEIRRYELALVNNLAEPIEVLSVLPSCGCVGVNGKVQGIKIGPYDGKSFDISVSMKDFRDVEIEAAWRRVGSTGRPEKSVARLTLQR